jgi:hypothetical protein
VTEYLREEGTSWRIAKRKEKDIQFVSSTTHRKAVCVRILVLEETACLYIMHIFDKSMKIKF